MKPRLYLETTIPSYLVARRSRDVHLAADQEATDTWWETRRTDFDMFVSEVVIREVNLGNAAYAGARLEKIRGIPILVSTSASIELTKLLLRERIIPEVASEDAAHIGIAAAQRMDFLLTWNCKHINNRFTVRRIERACASCGLLSPVIATPEELLTLEP